METSFFIVTTSLYSKIILGSLYILFGMGLIGMCINLMQEKIFLKVTLSTNYFNYSMDNIVLDQTNWAELGTYHELWP